MNICLKVRKTKKQTLRTSPASTFTDNKHRKRNKKPACFRFGYRDYIPSASITPLFRKGSCAPLYCVIRVQKEKGQEKSCPFFTVLIAMSAFNDHVEEQSVGAVIHNDDHYGSIIALNKFGVVLHVADFHAD